MFRKRLSQARVFLALAVLSMAVGGCLEKAVEVIPDKGNCGLMGKYHAPAYYKIVNKTKQTIFVDHLYKIQVREPCSNADRYYPQNNSISPGSTYRGPLVDPLYNNGWYNQQNAKIRFAPTTLIAIRLNESTIAYYTGYPRSLSSELRSWLTANESHLDPSFYTPMPTAGTMDVYGLFYIVGNTGRTLLGLPTIDPDYEYLYTSLDSQNRPYLPPWLSGSYGSGGDFLMTFTVNGPNKSDIAVTYEGTPMPPP